MGIIDYVGLGLLFFSILYTGRQVGIYLRMRKRMGKVVAELSPSKGQKKGLIAAGIVFLILMAGVTYNYVANDVTLGVTYATLVAVVIYSTGRFTSKITELREEGLLGHLNEISYSEIKSYKVEERKARGAMTFRLKDGREFVSLVALGEIDGIKAALKKKL